MSLVYCNECGKEVSDKASNCPNCGNPINVAPIQSQPQYQQQQQPQKPIKPAKKPESALGNVAIILSLLGCLAPIGFILAIIDLCINNKTKRHETAWGALIICIIWLVLAFNLGGGKSDEDETKSTKVNQSTEATTKDDTIDFEYADLYVKFLESEIKDGQLYVYFEMTNNSDENDSFGYTFDTTAFQNGIELETDYVYSSDEEKNADKEIQPGATIKLAEVFELSDNTSKVTIEVEPLITFTDNKLIKFDIELK